MEERRERQSLMNLHEEILDCKLDDRLAELNGNKWVITSMIQQKTKLFAQVKERGRRQLLINFNEEILDCESDFCQ